MLLMEYAKKQNILKSKKAKIVEVRDNGNDITLLYRIDGQKYVNNNSSARTLSKAVAEQLEVDDSGYLISGNVIRKNNFWIWVEDNADEA